MVVEDSKSEENFKLGAVSTSVRDGISYFLSAWRQVFPEDYRHEFKGKLISLDDVNAVFYQQKTLDQVLSQV